MPDFQWLENEEWYELPDGGLVTTDDNGEGWVDISQDGRKCMLVYIFQTSELIKAACPKSDYTGGNVTCSLAGTSVYNNTCASQIIIQTLSAEIQLDGTWIAVTYLPDQQVTVAMVFDADQTIEDQITVWPVQQTDPRILGGSSLAVTEEHFWFSVPGVRADPIAGLEARVAHPFDRLLPLVEALDLWPWIDRIKKRADADNVPYPDFPPFGPTPTATVTPTPLPPLAPTATPCGPPPNWIIYIVQPNDTLFSLATKTFTTIDQINLANCLIGDTIYEGQRLYLPFVPPTPTPTPIPCGPPPNWVIYIVQPNDTLFSLATKTFTTINQIKLANCMIYDTIYEGQILYLPFVPVPPTSEPEPEPATPIPTPLKVAGVEFLYYGRVAHVLTVDDLLEEPPSLGRINAIRVTFNKYPNKNTIEAGSSFLVQRDWHGLADVPGSIQYEESPSVVRFDIDSKWFKDEEGYVTLPLGIYIVTLVGDEDPQNPQRLTIADPEGYHLDGEPTQLPSGNGTPGGDFVFQFTIPTPTHTPDAVSAQ
jgi:LysM repeat protein